LYTHAGNWPGRWSGSDILATTMHLYAVVPGQSILVVWTMLLGRKTYKAQSRDKLLQRFFS